MLKNKKNIIIFTIILIIIVTTSTLLIYYYWKNDKKIIWNIIDETEYDQSILTKNSWTWDLLSIEKQTQNDYDQITSKIKALCNIWDDINILLWLRTFTLIKKSIDEIRDKQENKEKFLYIDLPWIVFWACPTSDSTYLNNLLKYLQAEWIENIQRDKIDISKYNTFLESISYKSENVDKTKIKNDKQYFHQIIFQDNLESIKSAYFSEYMSKATDSDLFFNTQSILSLEETNSILEKTVWDFQNFVIKIWFSWIEELRTYILKNNGYSNVWELTNSMKTDYAQLKKLINEKYEMDLNWKLLTIDSTANFYKIDYPTLIQDNEIKKLFNKIWESYLYFSIVNSDYADWLDETWSGMEFFWDTIVWNSIIKIWYIYLYDSSKK